MRTFTQEQLKSILEKHRNWLLDLAGGERANLSGSDLSGSDLSRCDLSGSDLSGSNLSGSDLSGSDLSRCDLSGSDLSGSDLSGSNLSRCDLSGCDLSGSDLSGSDLSRCDLSGCDLSGSDLSGSDLSRCDLSGSDLSGSDLSGSNLSRCDLSGSDLSGSDLSGAKNVPPVEPLQNIRSLILERITDEGCSLNMRNWHSCDTVHCLGGWACTIHPQGRLIESLIGTNAAAALIFNASCGEVPDFFTIDEVALEWLKKDCVSEPQNA